MNTPEQLPPHIAALIASANEADMPTAGVRANVWHGLVYTLGPEATHVAVGTSVVVLSKAGLGLLLAAVAVGGAVVGGTVEHLRSVPAPQTSSVVVAAPVPAVPVAAPAPVVAAPTPAAVVAAPIARVSLSTTRATSSPAPTNTTPAAPGNASERLLIERARAALGRGDLDGARTALDLHAGSYPAGALSEDRDALRVLRHYLAGSAVASSEDVAFRSRYPSSVYRPVLDRAAHRAAPAKDLPAAPQFSR
jgi:hypothetical protein